MSDVFIIDAVRTPIGAYLGNYKKTESVELGTTSLKELFDRNKTINTKEIEGLIFITISLMTSRYAPYISSRELVIEGSWLLSAQTSGKKCVVRLLLRSLMTWVKTAFNCITGSSPASCRKRSNSSR